MEFEADYLAYLDPAPATTAAARVSTPKLREPAAAFAENVRAAYDLAIFPQYIVTRSTLDREFAQRAAVTDVTSSQEFAKDELSRLSLEPKTAACMKAVRRAVITEVWTAFECLANDILDLLRQRGTKNPPRGLDTIRKEYHKVLGEDAALQRVFDDPSLSELAALRHLMVHRGGIVDDKFKRESGAPEDIGKPARIDGGRVMRLANAGVAAGVQLLAYVEPRL